MSAANRVVTDQFEPGSVAKIVPSSAALDLGDATPDTYWHVTGVHKSDVFEIEDVEQHGNVDLTTTQIIAVSSNIGAVLIGQHVGPENMEKYLRAYGFGQPSGLGLPNETAGTLAPAKDWSDSQRDTINYGQGIAVTAIQLAAAMNAIANHGTYVAPRLVDATIDKAGQRHESAPSATHPVLKPETAAAMVPILEQVWCDGTARNAPRIEGYSVAGKTGTGYIAQNAKYMVVGADGKLREDGYKDAQGKRHYNASFAGFLPAENPQDHHPRHHRRPARRHRHGTPAALRRQRRGAGVQRHRPRGAATAADPPISRTEGPARPRQKARADEQGRSPARRTAG